MNDVATLIAAPGRLEPATVARVRAELAGAGEPRWLALGEAADIDFDGNGVVNNADYVQFRNRFGKVYTY